jgi:lipase chaperone LimK
MRRRVVFILIVLLVPLAVSFWLRRSTQPTIARLAARAPLPAGAPLLNRVEPLPPAALPAAPAGAQAREPLPPLPASLHDTEIDGDLVVDGGGRFVVTVETRRLFDYFLSATGEEPDDVIVERIRAVIDDRLPPGAAAQARQLLDRYMDYRARARVLFESGDEAEDLEKRLDLVRDLRRRVFGDEDARALFHDDEERAHFAAEAQRRLADPNLTQDQRRMAVEDLETQMPESLRADRDAALGPARLARDESALRNAGGSPEEIRALRESRFGKEAADRLEELDRKRAEWQQRLDAYRNERAAIEADPSLSPEQRRQRLEDLRASRFDEREAMRVEVQD